MNEKKTTTQTHKHNQFYLLERETCFNGDGKLINKLDNYFRFVKEERYIYIYKIKHTHIHIILYTSPLPWVLIKFDRNANLCVIYSRRLMRCCIVQRNRDVERLR